MVKPQFRQLDVESMGQLCKKKERKQELARLKRQREREEQQHQSHLPPTALPTPLESDVGTLVATEAQTIGFASADFGNLCGIDDLAFNFVGIDWNDNGNNIAHALGSFVPPSGIGSITTATTKPISLEETKSPSELWSPWTTPIAQPPTEQTAREESNVLPGELSLVPDLVNCSTAHIRPTSCVITDLNTAITEGKGRSESGNTCENCGDDGSANNDGSSSDGEDTDGESCSQELAVPGPKLTVQDLSGIAASHILSKSHSAAPDSTRAPSCPTSPIPSSSIEVPAAPLDSVEEPQTDVFALPTPSSDHASISQQRRNAITSRRKRGHAEIEDGYESHDRRLPKRRRSRDASSGTASPVLPARSLRVLLSRALVDKPGKRGLTTQCDRQLRHSPRSQPRPRTAGAMSCSNDHLRSDGLPALNVDNASRGGKRTGRRQGRSPTITGVTSPRPDHSSGKPGPQRCGPVSVSPVATPADPFSATCHTCGFSAEHLLQLIDTIQALIGRGAEPPDSERGLDMLQLFLGFISDYATKRLPHNATSARNINRSDVMNCEQALEATVELPNSKTFKNSDSSKDNSGEDSDSERESASSDRSDSPGVLEEMGKRPQRRRWTSLDELRLRAWVQEEKKWSWIAGKLQRSEQAIIQHWKIMGKRDKKTTE